MALWTSVDDIASALILDSTVNVSEATAGSVSRWDDERNNGLYVEQATSSLQPATGVDSVNGLNSISFSTHRLRTPDSTFTLTGNTAAIIIVCTLADTGQNGQRIGSLIGTNNTDWNTVTGGFLGIERLPLRTRVFRAPISEARPQVNLTANTPIILSAIWDGSNMITAVNGAYTTNEALTGSFDSTNFNIGDSNDDGRLVGTINKIVVTTDTSTSNLDKHHGYLADKYALQADLPANHPYKNVPPQTTAVQPSSLLQIMLSSNQFNGGMS